MCETNFEFPASKSAMIAAKFCCSCGAKIAIRGYLINLVFFAFSRTFCVMCEFRKQDIKYYLRGLCDESRHDRVYYLHQDFEDIQRPIFKGESSSIIIWVFNICVKKHFH